MPEPRSPAATNQPGCEWSWLLRYSVGSLPSRSQRRLFSALIRPSMVDRPPLASSYSELSQKLVAAVSLVTVAAEVSMCSRVSEKFRCPSPSSRLCGPASSPGRPWVGSAGSM